MRSRPYLDEVGERAATGETARIYAEIRSAVGVPFVSLVYRHLATQPRLLRRTWAKLRPLVCSDNVHGAAAELAKLKPPDVVPIPASALAAVGLRADELEAADATLRAYDRANSVNLLALQIMLKQTRLSGSEPLVTSIRSKMPELALLPMCDLQELDGPVLALIEELSLPLGGRERPLLIPSLWRHFGDYPALLALLWTSMRRPLLDGSLDRGADALLADTERVAGSFRVDEIELDGSVRSLFRRFLPAMSRMVVCSAAIRSALTEGDIFKATPFQQRRT